MKSIGRNVDLSSPYATNIKDTRDKRADNSQRVARCSTLFRSMHAKSFDSLFFINYYVKTGPLSSNESLQSDLYPFDKKILVLRVVLPFELSLLYWIKINPIIRRVEVILINLLFLSFAFWNSFRDILFFFFFKCIYS